MRLTKICWPWNNLKCLGFKFGEEWYLDIYLTSFQLNFWPYWYIKYPVMYIGWNKNWGKFKPKWICKSCRPRMRMHCIENGYCVCTATYFSFRTFKIKNS